MMQGFGFGFGRGSTLLAGATTPPSPQPIGVIYDKTLGDNLADWTINNFGTSSFTQSGTDAILSGTGGTGGTGVSNLFKAFMSLNTTAHAITSLRKWKIKVDLTLGSNINNGTSFGIGLGVYSTNGFELLDSCCRIHQDNTSFGRSTIYYGNTRSIGIGQQQAVGGTHTLTANTRYYFEFEQDETTFYSRVYNSSDVLQWEETRTDNLTTNTTVHHNTGRFTITQFGGTTTIHRVTISSNALRYPKTLFVGDSLSYGGKASSLANRWIEQYMDTGTWTLLAGWADRTTEMESRKAEIAAISPQYVLIATGSNDIKDTSWTSTGNGKLDDLITYIQNNTSATIVLVTPGARNDVNVTQVKTDMDTKGLTVIDAFTVTKQPAGTGLLAAYNGIGATTTGGDGIHWNNAGHLAVANEAISVLPDAR